MSKRVWTLWVIPATIAHVLDVVTTYIGLSMGFYESNPFIRSLIEQRGLGMGLLMFLGFRFLIIALGVLLCWTAQYAREIFPGIFGRIISLTIYIGLACDLIIGYWAVANNLILLAAALAP